ncbi:MAG: hypothetical protein FWF30_00460 [Coriobacteriia bacterium]|nr:hypothetical protein [Coriobacteriia bacterium]
MFIDLQDWGVALEVLAGILGCLAGVIGALPYILLGQVIRRRFIEQGPKAMKLILLIPFLSVVVLLGAFIVFWMLAPGFLMVFAVAGVIVFIVSTVMFTMLRLRRN